MHAVGWALFRAARHLIMWAAGLLAGSPLGMICADMATAMDAVPRSAAARLAAEERDEVVDLLAA